MNRDARETTPWRAASEPEEFVVVVRAHSAAIHAYLSRRAGRHAADDLLAEVWLRAFRSRHSYDPASGNLRPWLYGIAGNTLKAHWGVQGRRAVLVAERGGDPWAEVDDRLDAQRLAPQLARALSQLDSDDRELLLLVAWEQLTPAEAAVALDIPQGTARSRLHRARHLLQHHLDTLLCRPGSDRQSAEA